MTEAISISTPWFPNAYTLLIRDLAPAPIMVINLVHIRCTGVYIRWPSLLARYHPKPLPQQCLQMAISLLISAVAASHHGRYQDQCISLLFASIACFIVKWAPWRYYKGFQVSGLNTVNT